MARNSLSDKTQDELDDRIRRSLAQGYTFAVLDALNRHMDQGRDGLEDWLAVECEKRELKMRGDDV